jgi:hypothetical protein
MPAKRNAAETYRVRATEVARAFADLLRYAEELHKARTCEHSYRLRDAQVDLARGAMTYAAKVRTLAGRNG